MFFRKISQFVPTLLVSISCIFVTGCGKKLPPEELARFKAGQAERSEKQRANLGLWADGQPLAGLAPGFAKRTVNVRKVAANSPSIANAPVPADMSMDKMDDYVFNSKPYSLPKELSKLGISHHQHCRGGLDQARHCFHDRTKISYDKVHGTQVEYVSNDRSYLWYAGNNEIVTAEARIQKPKDPRFYQNPDVCFRYSETSYNPSTRQRGGKWECRSSGSYFRKTGHVGVGDVFGLSSGRVPYVMKKGHWFVFELMERKAAL